MIPWDIDYKCFRSASERAGTGLLDRYEVAFVEVEWVVSYEYHG